MCWPGQRDHELPLSQLEDRDIFDVTSQVSRACYGLGRGVVVTPRTYGSDIIELASIYVDNSQHDFWQQPYRIEVGDSEHHPEVRSVAHGQS